MLPTVCLVHYELLASRLFQARIQSQWLTRKLSTTQRVKTRRPMEIPKGLIRVSERCQLVPSPHRDAWQWPVDPTKVLVVLMTWLGAKERHVFKYSNLYTKQGVDVLIVKSLPSDFLWPPNSVSLARQVFGVLDSQMKGYDHLIFHTMSAGSYNFTTFRQLLKGMGNPDSMLNKFRGQVLDSVTAGAGKGGVFEEFAADGVTREQVHAVDRMIEGVVTAAKKGPVVSWMIKCAGKSYVALTKRQTLRAYEESLKFFREEPLERPTLFLASRDDPMCDAKVLERLVELWKKEHSFPVSIKVWDSSPHTQHYLVHTEEYEQLQNDLFREIFLNLAPGKPFKDPKSKL